MTLRAPRLVVVVVLVVGFARDAIAGGGPSKDVAADIQRAQEALTDWQLDEAVAIAEKLDHDLPDVPPVQDLLGSVKFHQGDYDGAVKLLRRAAESGQPPQLLALAESTLKETQGGVTSESAHFIIRTPPGKDELLQPIALWALEKAFAEQTAAFDYKPRHKIMVDVLQDASGLASVSTLTVKEIETSGTIALCKFNRLMITSPKALARGYSWLDTLSHELVHLIVSEKSHNTVPVWLHEGLAKYNESRWRGAPGLALEPASEGLLANAFKKNKLITFEQMHPSMAKLPSQEDAALAFAEVFTVIEFAEKEKPKSPNAVIDALKDGDAMDAALKKGFGVDLAGLQSTWKAYLKKRAFKIVPGAEPTKLTFVKNARKSGKGAEEQEDDGALDEAKSAAGKKMVRLGNLLREKRRLKAASIEYEKAVAQVGVRSPILHNRLAGVYLELGDVDSAKKILGDISAAFPDDPQTHVLLGRIALRNKEWNSARENYERATWEAPFNPEIHAALYHVAEQTHDDLLLKQEQHAIELLMGAAKSSSAVPAAAAKGEPYGILEVRAEPWGRLLLDGVDTGTTTPVVDYRVKPGPHRIRVIDPIGGKEQGQAVAITEGQTTRVSIALEDLSPQKRQALVDAEEALLKPALPEPAHPASKQPSTDKPVAPWDVPDDDDGMTPDLPSPPR